MIVDWAHALPSFTASFLASIVEFVEALTVVLAVGTVRGWRGALAGSGAAILLLLLIVVILGPALTLIPLRLAQLVVGLLLLLFGMRWLRKAILRAAGVISLHDEDAIFARRTEALRGQEAGRSWDRIAVMASFKITMLEGIEVVFIVVAVGASGAGLLIPASVGAFAALLVVMLLGLAIHKPLSAVPENTLKFVVGVLLSAFGCFWFGEGIGIGWPDGDWSLPGLIAVFLITAFIGVAVGRWRSFPGAG